MLALCLMLLTTYYAQNHAGMIGWSLHMTNYLDFLWYFSKPGKGLGGFITFSDMVQYPMCMYIILDG